MNASNASLDFHPQRCPNLQRSLMFVLIAGISSASGLICIVGNAIVTWTIYRTRRLHCVSYFLISSLALADGMVGLLLNPMLTIRVISFSYINYTSKLPPMFSLVDDFLWIQGLLVSTLSLTAISVDRYIAVRRSLYYNSLLTLKRCRLVIFFTWIFPTFIASFRIFLNNEDHKWLWLSTVILAVCFPLGITSYSYYKLFSSAREQAKRLDHESVKNTKAAKTMAIVLGVFSVTYLPSIVIACIHAFKQLDGCQMEMIKTTAWPWVMCVAYTSSAINPWIYSVRMTAFRHAIRKAFRRQLNDH